MAYIPDQLINTGSYVPTTNIWDVARIYDIDVNSKEFKELLVRLYQNINNISIALNQKTTGFYLTQEFVSGKLFFNPNSSNQLDLRAGFLIVIDTGSLGAGVNTIPHGLTIGTTWAWARINGAAFNNGTFDIYPLPFAGAAGNNIEVRANATNIIINNASGITFTTSMVILEYVKN